jgi:hypothetical protein
MKIKMTFASNLYLTNYEQKKSPEINQPVSAGHQDLRVSADLVGCRESKNIYFVYFKEFFLFLEF